MSDGAGCPECLRGRVVTEKHGSGYWVTRCENVLCPPRAGAGLTREAAVAEWNLLSRKAKSPGTPPSEGSAQVQLGTHSPGPWRWEQGDDEVDRLFDANGREVVCGWSHGRQGYVSCLEQDAKLIAKAPEMAQMLRGLRDFMQARVAARVVLVAFDGAKEDPEEQGLWLRLSALLRDLP